MIPKLLDSTKPLKTLVNDKSEGLGRLSDVTSCKVTEERNGAYTVEMKMPIDGVHFGDIKTGALVLVKANQMDAPQIFRVNKISKPVRDVVTIYGNHITYDLNKTAVLPFEATGAANAVNTIKTKMMSGAAFTISTDISNTSTVMRNKLPQSARALFGGQNGSLLDLFGGEYHWDNLNVRLLSKRGTDNGVTIAYGKNLVDLKQEETIDSMYTAVLPYVVKDEVAIVGDLVTVLASSEPRILNVDVSDKFSDLNEKTPSKAEITAKGKTYAEANDLATPKVNLTISYVNLADTVEYANKALLETVSLCDTVHVKFEKLGVNATAKVIKTVYDSLTERYDSIEVGNARSSLASTINNMVDDANKLVEEKASFLQKAIEHASNLIKGGLGGHMVINTNDVGEPNELLFMDTDNIDTAKNVLRINMNGIGFSSTGYNGPFKTAWTLDGGFVADFISSGKIKAIDIEGSTIKGSTIKGGTIKSTTTIFNEGSENPSRIVSGNINIYDFLNKDYVNVKGAILAGGETGDLGYKTGLIVCGSLYSLSTDYPSQIGTSNDHSLNLQFGNTNRKIQNGGMYGGNGIEIINSSNGKLQYIGVYDNSITKIYAGSLLDISSEKTVTITAAGTNGGYKIVMDSNHILIQFGNSKITVRNEGNDLYIANDTSGSQYIRLGGNGKLDLVAPVGIYANGTKIG